MSGSLKARFAVGFVNTLVRVLGPYRIWRLFHVWAEQHPQMAQELLQYVFDAEMPRKWLDEKFLARWLQDRETIAILRHQSVKLDSPFYALLVFRQVLHACLAEGCIPRRVLEIGPGVHLGAAFCFAAMGVKEVAVVDIARIKPELAFYHQLKDLLAVAGGYEWWRYNAVVNPYKELSYPHFADRIDAAEVLRRILIKSPVSAEHLPFPANSFDLVYSINAFEHFPHPEQSVREVARVLCPGGLAVCEIDLRYHCDMRSHPPEDTLKFLEWSDAEWRSKSEEYSEERALKGCLKGEWGREVFCNRLRWRQWIELFTRADVEILKAQPLEVLSENKIRRERFVEPFRSMPAEDLSVLVGRLTARKK